jgi:hypothetical protein
MLAGFKVVKLFPYQITYHRRGNQKLVRPQEGISGKVNQGNFLKTSSRFNKHNPDLCGRSIGDLGFYR